jgi:hypothetical protein
MSAIKATDSIFSGLAASPEIRSKHEGNPQKSSSPSSATSPANGDQDVHQIAVRYQEHLFHNQLASELRTAERDLVETDELLAKMREKLTRIVKNFPPYPLDNPERFKMLQSFIGLRKEIERLMVPAPRDAILSKITDEMKSVDIPTLSSDAADKEIERALAEVVAAQEQKSKDRENLTKEAATMAMAIQSPMRLVEWLKSQGITTALIDEREAEQQSLAAGNALASEQSAHITTLQDLLPR